MNKENENDINYDEIYPALGHLLGCYFHEDFDDVYDNNIYVCIKDYIDGTNQNKILRALSEMQELINQKHPEKKLEKVIISLGAHHWASDPPATLPAYEWLGHIRGLVEAELKRKGESS